MRLSELCRGADPARADNEENLRQNEIEKTKRFLETFAACFDLLLSALEFSSHRSSVEGLKRSFAVILSGAPRSRRIPWCDQSIMPRDSSTSLGMTFALGALHSRSNPGVPPFSAALVRYEIRDAGFCRRHKRCSHRPLRSLRRERLPESQVVQKTLAILSAL